MKKQLHLIISGRVQGVLFRDYTRRQARALGLVGFVQNLPDGTVEVVAEDQEDSLNKLIEAVRKGSTFSRVKDVKVEWRETSGEFSEFTIRYCGFWDRL